MAMARARLLVLTLASLLSSVARVDGAGAPAPAPGVDCTDALVSLAGCLSYVQEGSTVTTPDPTCCSGLKDVVRNEVACLCQAFQGGQDFGVALNMTKALQLPAACNVKTPPFSKCNISVPGVTGGAPAPPFFGQSPSSSTPSASPSSAAGTGSDFPTATPASAPSPARSDAVMFPAPTQTFIASAAVAAATLLVCRVL
ncbi:hypothetical protein PR202_ga26762 [Eleusine coracana subsp. coracana]|uniref:Bifunctional inhibitor/plant lipid transfer protein/seed storage helical domain-containing protein n=1 Tax=Eleusine coracana subsp. coracana TaxID=191504 RepID=A0AAV5DEZ4_ELECO|nr:hypothetical protein PR202_ga26762 [Eleusine coracana subsp. coracana]